HRDERHAFGRPPGDRRRARRRAARRLQGLYRRPRDHAGVGIAMTSPSFRPAAKSDASALAVLVDIAGEGMPSFLWSALAAPGQSPLEVGRERAQRETGGFSYRNATVAEIGGEI